MRVKFYTIEPAMHLNQTEFGLLLCQSEDLSSVPRERIQLAVEKGARVNQQHKNRILLDSGAILQSMNDLGVLPVPQADQQIGEMITLCDQQMSNPAQMWLVDAVSLRVLERGVGPEFLGYPQGGMKPATFQVTYRDGSTHTYRQSVHSLPEDVEVTTEELQPVTQ